MSLILLSNLDPDLHCLGNSRQPLRTFQPHSCKNAGRNMCSGMLGVTTSSSHLLMILGNNTASQRCRKRTIPSQEHCHLAWSAFMGNPHPNAQCYFGEYDSQANPTPWAIASHWGPVCAWGPLCACDYRRYTLNQALIFHRKPWHHQIRRADLSKSYIALFRKASND